MAQEVLEVREDPACLVVLLQLFLEGPAALMLLDDPASPEDPVDQAVHHYPRNLENPEALVVRVVLMALEAQAARVALGVLMALMVQAGLEDRKVPECLVDVEAAVVVPEVVVML